MATTKQSALADIARLEALDPAPSPTAHWPFVVGPEDVSRIHGRHRAYVIGPEFSASPSARKTVAAIQRVGG